MTDEATKGTVLVVDADYEVLGGVAEALRRRGYHVVLAADGRAGLQRAVEVAADVVMVDRDVPVVDVRMFFDVLKDNPRTSGAHAFILGSGDPTQLQSIEPRAEPLIKPFNIDEIAARVEQALSARSGPREPELRGDLAQVSMFDLLQVFAVNSRTGEIRLDTDSASGEIWLDHGRIVDASFGGVVGAKALYRALGERNGQFVFLPDVEAPGEQRISSPIDHLLMEAARQKDEADRLQRELPDLGALVARARNTGASADKPVMKEIMEALDEPRSIDALLNFAGVPDLDVLQAVHELLADGSLLVLDPSGQRARLCTDSDRMTMRTSALRMRRQGFEGPPRLGVLSLSPNDIDRFSRALASVDEFAVASRAAEVAGMGALGPLGVMRIGGTDLELYSVPIDPDLRPLWGAFLGPARMVLVLANDGMDIPDLSEPLKQLDLVQVVAAPGWDRPSGAASAVRSALMHNSPKSSEIR